MPRPTGSTKQPSYRLHLRSGQAVTTIAGKDYYLGAHGTPASKQNYDRLIAEWYRRGRQGPAASGDSATVAQVAAGYIEYRPANEQAKGRRKVVTAMHRLCSIYGNTSAAEFDAQKLMALRDAMARMIARPFGKDAGRTLCRTTINNAIAYVKLAFRWAHQVRMVPASVCHSLSTVTSWRPGEGPARGSKKVRPVDDRHVEAVLEVANPILAAMIRLQWLTGMRCGEVFQMRACDIDMTKPVWEYRPATHKTQKRGIERVIRIGPKAQGVIRPFLRAEINAPLFSPADSDRCQLAIRRTASGIRLCHYTRQRAVRAKEPMFNAGVYCTCIKHACDRADKLAHLRNPNVPSDKRIVPRWQSHQLRHSAATFIARECGIDTAREVLGHTSRAMTERYAERGTSAAERAMAAWG